MRLATSIGYSSDQVEAAKRAIDLEQRGLIDAIWVAEAYSNDAVSLLGYLAHATTRAQLGSGILPIYSRTPSLTAMSASGLDALSGGRLLLGLGTSGPQVIEGFHGVPFDKPIARTREVIEICRQVWRRDPVVHDGSAYHLPLPEGQGTGLGKPLKLIAHPVRERIPIYVAALGEKNVELTAELAEGWMPTVFIPERMHDVWGDALKRGTEKRAADLGPLELSAGAAVAIGDDVEHLRDQLRPSLAFSLGGMGARTRNFYNDVARRSGFEAEAREVQDLFLAGKRDEAAKAVPAGLLEGTSVIGPEGYVRDRLAAYAEVGVTSFTCRPIGPDPEGTLTRFRELLPD
jgi:F420-dependent oxidoreductase-like protein